MRTATIGDTWYLMGGYRAGVNPTDGYYVSLEALASDSAKVRSNIRRILPSLNYYYSCPLNIFGGIYVGKCVSTIQRYVSETNTWVAASRRTTTCSL